MNHKLSRPWKLGNSNSIVWELNPPCNRVRKSWTLTLLLLAVQPWVSYCNLISSKYLVLKVSFRISPNFFSDIWVSTIGQDPGIQWWLRQLWSQPSLNNKGGVKIVISILNGRYENAANKTNPNRTGPQKGDQSSVLPVVDLEGKKCPEGLWWRGRSREGGMGAGAERQTRILTDCGLQRTVNHNKRCRL